MLLLEQRNRMGDSRMKRNNYARMQQTIRKSVYVVLVGTLFLTTTGCQKAQETLTQVRQELRQEIALEQVEQQAQEVTPINRLEIPSMEELLQDEIHIEETYEPVQTMGMPIQEITVALYFADTAGESLVKTEKRIPKVEGLARATIETLLEGPDANSGLVSAIPEGAQLLDINVKAEEKKCIVDFSQELRNHLKKGSKSEQLAVYAITNTLCQFPAIEQVEFRIEGQSVETLAGKTSLGKAVTANAQIVK